MIIPNVRGAVGRLTLRLPCRTGAASLCLGRPGLSGDRRLAASPQFRFRVEGRRLKERVGKKREGRREEGEEQLSSWRVPAPCYACQYRVCKIPRCKEVCEIMFAGTSSKYEPAHKINVMDHKDRDALPNSFSADLAEEKDNRLPCQCQHPPSGLLLLLLFSFCTLWPGRLRLSRNSRRGRGSRPNQA